MLPLIIMLKAMRVQGEAEGHAASINSSGSQCTGTWEAQPVSSRVRCPTSMARGPAICVYV